MMGVSFSALGFLFLLPLLVLLIEVWLWRIRIFPYLSQCKESDIVKGIRDRQDGGVSWRINGFFKRGLILMVTSFVWLLLLNGFGLAFLWGDVYFLALVVALMMFDAKYWILPDPAVYLLLWGGILWSFIGGGPQSLESSILGVVMIYTAMLLLYSFGWLYYKQEAIGRGDLKFSAAIGAWIGGGNALFFLLMSAMVGVFLAVIYYLKVSRNWKAAIPFGPSLGFSGIILYFIERLITAL